MINRSKAEYFDGIAEEWDGWQAPDLAGRLAAGLEEFGVSPGETVIDIGCGTGNLTLALLDRLSTGGRVVSIDFSPAMVEKARSKITDPRAGFHVRDAADLPVEDGSADRVICYSVWPHFDDPAAAVKEFERVLRPGGLLHVWHLSSRETINEIHSSAGEAVSGDMLPPADETAAVIERGGFTVLAAREDEAGYLVTASKGGRPG